MATQEQFSADHIHTTLVNDVARHFRHGDGVEVDGNGNPVKTVTVRLLHNASIPGARWCESVGWEPANEIAGSELVDGAWWDADEQTAGLVWFGDRDAYGANEKVEVNLSALRVASCGNCRVIGEVEIA